MITNLVTISLFIATSAAAAEKLTIGYTDGGGVYEHPGHFRADYLRAAEMIWNDSGLDALWVKLPGRRLLHEVKTGAANFCVAGATITAERAAFGKFSQPFRRDRILSLALRADRLPSLDGITSFAQLSKQSGRRYLTIGGLNYGFSFSATLRQLGNQVIYEANDVAQIYDMLLQDRADFGIVPTTMGQLVLGEREQPGLLRLVNFPDMRRDADMAVYCSNAVSDEVLTAINQAIARQLPNLANLFPDQTLAP